MFTKIICSFFVLGFFMENGTCVDLHRDKTCLSQKKISIIIEPQDSSKKVYRRGDVIYFKVLFPFSFASYCGHTEEDVDFSTYFSRYLLEIKVKSGLDKKVISRYAYGDFFDFATERYIFSYKVDDDDICELHMLSAHLKRPSFFLHKDSAQAPSLENIQKIHFTSCLFEDGCFFNLSDF